MHGRAHAAPASHHALQLRHLFFLPSCALYCSPPHVLRSHYATSDPSNHWRHDTTRKPTCMRPHVGQLQQPSHQELHALGFKVVDFTSQFACHLTHPRRIVLQLSRQELHASQVRQNTGQLRRQHVPPHRSRARPAAPSPCWDTMGWHNSRTIPWDRIYVQYPGLGSTYSTLGYGRPRT